MQEKDIPKEPQINSVTKCPTCGCPCDVHSEGETHFYVPKSDAAKEIHQSKWIDVNIERPVFGVVVLIALKHSIQTDVYAGYRANGGWYCVTLTEKHFIPNGIEEAKITHWMKLPLPPVPVKETNL